MEAPVTTPQYWWVLALGGVFSILFGLAALVWPGLTLIILVWLYGFYALLYGIVQIVGMFRAIGQHRTWWPQLLLGLVSIGAGLFVLFNPGLGSLALLLVIAIWAIVLGTVEVVTGITQANLLLVVMGVISVLFGLVLFANPFAGALALVWVIGVFATVRGIVLLVGAFQAPTVGERPLS